MNNRYKVLGCAFACVLLSGICAFCNPVHGGKALPAAKAGASAVSLLDLVSRVRKTPLDEVGDMAKSIENRPPVNKKELSALFDLLNDFGEYDDAQILCDAVTESLSKTATPDPAMLDIVFNKLRSGKVASQGAATLLVTRLKSRDAVPYLIDMVNGFMTVKPAAVVSEAEEAVRVIRQEKENKVFCLALDAFEAIGDERAIPLLVSLLGKTGDGVGTTLAGFGHKAFAEVLDAALHSSDPKARSEAWDCIGRMRDPEVVPQVWQLMGDGKEKPRKEILAALIQSCDERTKPTLDEFGAYIRAMYAKNREFLPEMLDLAARKKDAATFSAMLQDKDLMQNTRLRLIGYIGALPRDSALPLLETALKDSDEAVRRAAAETMTRITGKKYPAR